jgi:hypothetical protein
MAIIEYNGSVVATFEGGNTATLPVKDLKMKSDIVITIPEGEGGGTDSPLPIAVSTETEMTALLTSGEVGGVYKYTGTTGTYENGALYVLEEEDGEAYFTIVQLGKETTYQFKQGMTWADWCEENYDDQSAYYVSGTNVYYIGSSNVVSYSDKTPVKYTDPINSNEKYTIVVTGGSPD